MKWNLWKKKQKDGVKLSRPKEMESRLGKMLVVELNYDPDWVWRLKSVTLKKPEHAHFFNFRIFDPVLAKMQGVSIENYLSLDTHPKLIYFDGSYDTYTWEIKINDQYKRNQPETAA